MIEGIRHIGIVISDIEKSMEFYTKYLGFQEMKTMEEGGHYIDKLLNLQESKVTTIKLKNEKEQVIELLYFQNPTYETVDNKLNNLGLTHFALTVDNLDNTYDSMREHGIEFLSGPQLSPDGHAKVVFCKDPNGVFIELVEVL